MKDLLRLFKQQNVVEDFDLIKIGLASPEMIRSWSFGEVKKPGSYPFVNGMTVINAVALGGGYTYRARENNIFITRAKDPSKTKQKATHDTIVLPGDVIEVPERFF